MMANQPLDTSTRLAVERTRLANERTLMAWIRTSTSLIAFGFTIFKFFQYLATEEHRRTIVSRWIVGMTMILIGLTGLALAWIQHRQQMKGAQGRGWRHAVLDIRNPGRLDRDSGCHRTHCGGHEVVVPSRYIAGQALSIKLRPDLPCCSSCVMVRVAP